MNTTEHHTADHAPNYARTSRRAVVHGVIESDAISRARCRGVLKRLTARAQPIIKHLLDPQVGRLRVWPCESVAVAASAVTVNVGGVASTT